MGKTPKIPSEKPGTNSVVPNTSVSYSVLPNTTANTSSVERPSFKSKKPSGTRCPMRYRHIQMPEYDASITASSLNANQSLVVKKSVQNLFIKHRIIKEEQNEKIINHLDKATENLGKLMAEAVAKRKLQKQSAKK